MSDMNHTVAPEFLVATDFAAIKAKQQATWASGDYSVIGTTLQIVGERLAESANIRAGQKVLDVAAGNGNTTLAAARRFADVTSTDYVPELLQVGLQRATADGLQVRFEVADVEQLPFADGSFDAVLSSFGAMFAPDHRKTADEMLRVACRGAKLGFANWTPEGFIGQLFKLVGRYVPPPAGVVSPALWGTEPYIVQLFGASASEIQCERKVFNFRYKSAAHWLHVFREYYGPTHRAFGALSLADQAKLEAEIIDLLNRFNTDSVFSLVVPSEYLEVVITKY